MKMIIMIMSSHNLYFILYILGYDRLLSITPHINIGVQ